MEHAASTAEIRFWKRLGIRLLRFFGVGCTFVGYFMALEWLVFEGRDGGIIQLGLGLIGLGVPHVLAANRLQIVAVSADAELARSMEPSFVWLLATSMIVPGAAFVFLLIVGPSATFPFFLLYPFAGIVWLSAVAILLASGRDSARDWARLLMIFAVSMVISLPICSGSDVDYARACQFYFAISAPWLAGVVVIYFRRGDEMTRWDRTFIRWGWLVLFAVAVPFFMMRVRVA